jgi:Ser/Thr protein kinase RdoA (MazF antagonist)
LRSGANHVFRAGDVVIRVAPAWADVAGQVRLARWLVAEGFRVAVPVADVEVVDGTQVSVWDHVPGDPARPIDYERLGAIVARLHRVEAERLDGVAALPFCADAAWLAIDGRLAQAEATGVVDAAGLAALRRAWEGLGDWRARAHDENMVVCHGDVHPHNVLMDGGEVVIVDWDAICIGPAAWDHAALLRWADRYGGPAGCYPDFARGYGVDLRDAQLAGDLAAVRLLAATINIILTAADDPSVAAEARARVRYWTGDPAAPVWTPL